MRQLVAFVVAVLGLSAAAVPAVAQTTMTREGAVAADKKVQGPSHKASGTVTKVDPAAGRVTIAHGPVQSLKWPAMTMAFGVADRGLLDRAQPGKKVDFEFVKQGTGYVLTKID